MKKILVFLLFIACSSSTSAQQIDTNDHEAILKEVQHYDSVLKAKTTTLASLDSAIKADSASLAKANAADSVTIQKRMKESSKSLEALKVEVDAAKESLQKYKAMADRHGGGNGYKGEPYPRLGVGLCWLIAVLIAAILIWLFVSHSWIKTALAENVNDKETKENPQYSAEAIMRLMANAGVGAGTQSADDQVRKTAVQNALDAAKLANENYVAVQNNALKTDDEKKAAKSAYDKALSDLGSLLNPASVSPVVMNSLIQLFPPTIEVSMKDKKNGNQPISRPSASRLLAFFSGMLLLFVALISTCFYVYFYLVTGNAPDLTKLTGVLIALGIGLAPYAVNKVANATSDKDKTI